VAGFENRGGLISDCKILLRLAGTDVNNGGMVTPQEMRLFALDCLRWSDETNNASHRDLMLQIAKTWMTTASSIERHVGNGGEMALPDLRNKLN
jgi:hypothetical protein